MYSLMLYICLYIYRALTMIVPLFTLLMYVRVHVRCMCGVCAGCMCGMYVRGVCAGTEIIEYNIKYFDNKGTH